ncbi:long polar fimbrial protein LpfD [Enterobacter sichuanensis]|uniref:long polar fimbrial protein LpfD n=1 Tax=Enterobacter TaxID=547 RepID=UPI001CD9B5BB|nr:MULTISPECIES: long polar fimbrial protein LpfD [Enterobacter]MCA2026669.1 long polar fimbrial protein LpfD [Enterobacter sp. K16B]MEA5171476.1 long polar fimbrial protein LpfD [Enterobacter sichuanensis]
MYQRIFALTGLVCAALFSHQALAADDWGPCTPIGGTRQFNALMIKTVTDTSENSSGTVFPDFYAWDLGETYQVKCECPDNNEFNILHFAAKTSLPFGHNDGSKKYFIVNNNIQIATKIWIEGLKQEYVDAPFPDETNLYKGRSACDVNPNNADRFSTGAKGSLSLYIHHPFVGQLDIPSTNIMELYGTYKPGVYSATPMSSVYLSGSVTVPQGCELASGSTLEIPFGEFQAHDFKDRKGQLPAGASPVTKELQFNCTNISDGVKILLRIEGTPNPNDSSAIDLGNPDIGAVIKNASGVVLKPNSTDAQALTAAPLTDNIHRTASTTLSFSPVSTTGKLPETGDFEGIATLRIDVE